AVPTTRGQAPASVLQPPRGPSSHLSAAPDCRAVCTGPTTTRHAPLFSSSAAPSCTSGLAPDAECYGATLHFNVRRSSHHRPTALRCAPGPADIARSLSGRSRRGLRDHGPVGGSKQFPIPLHCAARCPEAGANHQGAQSGSLRKEKHVSPRGIRQDSRPRCRE
ncbi:unnamed protein product, partial [Symbiodinium necroappetens]